MNKKIRIIISLIFLLLFLTFAPLLILYSSGYQYDFKKRKLIKTGSLVLDTKPRGASVFIDGKLAKKVFTLNILPLFKGLINVQSFGGETPTIIKNLLPGEYLIEIRKEKYQGWKKKLGIESGRVTLAERILLFLEKPIVTQLLENAETTKVSPDKKKILFLSNNEVKVFDLEREKVDLVSKDKVDFLEWSPSSKKVLIGSRDHYHVYNIENQKREMSIKDFRNVKWDKESDNFLYGAKDDNIYKIDLATKKKKLIFRKIKGDYLIRGNFIYYLKNFKDYSSLNFSPVNQKVSFEIARLPLSEYYFLNSPSNFLALLDKKNREIFLIDLKEEEIVLRSKGKTIEWWGDKLLYYNDFEVNIFDPKKEKQETIIRTSKEIKKALFHNSGNYIFVSFNDEVQAIELDFRDKINVSKIGEGKIKEIILGEDDRFVYVLGEINNKNGLFKIKIQ